MKLTYSDLNENEPKIEINKEINLDTQVSQKEEAEIKVINAIHHIMEIYADAFHLKLKECSYDLESEDTMEIEFQISVEGNPNLAAMMIIAAHGAIIRNAESTVDAFYGTIHISHEESSSCLVFNAVPAEKLKEIKH
ncbi:MAG: hypothetical protein IKU28_04475 [Erysipelotrichaceae bacterium]|nr:hypothetical protein [Erysipelotrichaceae bacterium]